MSYKAYKHQIRDIFYEDIVAHRYKGKAAKEGVVSDEHTKYFGFFLETTLVAFVGYMQIGATYRFKSDWVNPQWRGQGIYQLLFAHRQEYISKVFKGEITAYCTDLSLPIYKKNGFEVANVITRGKKGINSTYVKKTI